MAGRGSIIGDELRRFAAAVELSKRTGIPANEIRDGAPTGGISRRDFLRKAAKTGAGLAALPAMGALAAACTQVRSEGSGPAPAPARPTPHSPRIAIVGAGLAGMTAAYRLMQAGHPSTVYEATDHVGGRTLTLRGYFDGGASVEQGGLWINSDHKAIINVAKELGLSLTNLDSYYPPNASGLYWFDGRPYDRQDVFADFQEVYPAVRRDLKAARYPTLYNHKTKAGVKLDNMSMTEWIERNVPGGTKSRFGQLLSAGYTGEYGLDTEVQPALNLIYELGYSPQNHLELYGPQDYKYRIEGGNQLVTETIQKKLPQGTVKFETPLVAVAKNSNGSFKLTFQPRGSAATEVVADKVILALPFTTLRVADLSKSGFDPLKIKTIKELGMGTNSKLYTQYSSRPWENRGWNGDSVSNLKYEETDIIYPPPSGEGAILLNYTGGSAGAGYGTTHAHGPAPAAAVDPLLQQLEGIQPGFKNAYIGKSWLAFWMVDPWTLGSYSCPTIGQISTLWGVAKIPQGNCFFAGEQTELNDYGFMTGAVGSGNRSAAEVVSSL